MILTINAQNIDSQKATKALSFLLGRWGIERIYSPESDNPVVVQGTLECQYGLSDQFIRCVYDMERSGKTNTFDVAYFNYNEIYNTYESLWLSTTWPIKVLLRGNLDKVSDALILDTKAFFMIQDSITEFVNDKLVWKVESADSFNRKTYVRTSQDCPDHWKYHMLEKARFKKGGK